MVIATTPSLHLFCQAIPGDPPRWHFVLESLDDSLDGATRLDVSDTETEIDGERLELLALVRGLEAIWQPSRLTVVCPSHFVRRGLEHGLSDWKRQGWCWESFGQLVSIKHADLWQRVDAALRFHELDVARHQLPANGLPSNEIQRPARPFQSRPFQSRPVQSDQQEHSGSTETVYPRFGSLADSEYETGRMLAATA